MRLTRGHEGLKTLHGLPVPGEITRKPDRMPITHITSVVSILHTYMCTVASKNFPTCTCSGTSKKGFTLIELIVLIVVIGVLAAVATSKYISIEQDARDAVARGMLTALRGASTVLYGQYIIHGSPGSYTMGEIVNAAGITGVDGYGSDASRFTLTVNGVAYTFTLEGPTFPSTPGMIRAQTADW